MDRPHRVSREGAVSRRLLMGVLMFGGLGAAGILLIPEPDGGPPSAPAPAPAAAPPGSGAPAGGAPLSGAALQAFLDDDEDEDADATPPAWAPDPDAPAGDDGDPVLAATQDSLAAPGPVGDENADENEDADADDDLAPVPAASSAPVPDPAPLAHAGDPVPAAAAPAAVLPSPPAPDPDPLAGGEEAGSDQAAEPAPPAGPGDLDPPGEEDFGPGPAAASPTPPAPGSGPDPFAGDEAGDESESEGVTPGGDNPMSTGSTPPESSEEGPRAAAPETGDEEDPDNDPMGTSGDPDSPGDDGDEDEEEADRGANENDPDEKPIVIPFEGLGGFAGPWTSSVPATGPTTARGRDPFRHIPRLAQVEEDLVDPEDIRRVKALKISGIILGRRVRAVRLGGVRIGLYRSFDFVQGQIVEVDERQGSPGRFRVTRITRGNVGINDSETDADISLVFRSRRIADEIAAKEAAGKSGAAGAGQTAAAGTGQTPGGPESSRDDLASTAGPGTDSDSRWP